MAEVCLLCHHVENVFHVVKGAANSGHRRRGGISLSLNLGLCYQCSDIKTGTTPVFSSELKVSTVMLKIKV